MPHATYPLPSPRGAPTTCTLFLYLLLLCLLLPACSGREPTAPLPPLAADARILAFGDSLTRGTGADARNSYPALLGDLLGREVINAGVPGEVSAAGLARLEELLDRERPALLLLCHGGNDLLRRQSEEQLIENLEAMIAMAQARNIPVVLIGVPARSLPLRPAELYRDVAQRTGVPLEAEVVTRVLNDRNLRADQIHPNAQGYRVMAEAVYQLLLEAGAVR